MPYQPNIQYRGDQFLFEGISSLGKSIGDGIRQFRQERDESRAADSAYETLLQLGGPDLLKRSADGEGPKLDDLAKFAGQSLSKKKAALGQLGVMLQLSRQSRQDEEQAKYHEDSLANQRAGLEIQRGNLVQQEAARQDRNTAVDRQRADVNAVARDTLGALMALSGQSALPSPVDPANPGEYVRSQFPQADPGEVGRWLRENAGGVQRLPQRMNLDGVDVVASPHTGQFQLLHDPKEKAPAAPNYEWVYSDDPAVFAQGVLGLPPEQLKEVIDRRNKFNHSIGRSLDPQQQLIANLAAALDQRKAPSDQTSKATPTQTAPAVKTWNPKTRRAE